MPLRRLLLVLLALVILSALPVCAGELLFDCLPITRNGHAFVPMRPVFEWLGATVRYEHGFVTAAKGPTRVTLEPGSTEAIVADKPFEIEAAPFTEKGRIYVPLRFSGEAFGAWVQPEGRVVRISLAQERKSAEMAIPPDPRSLLGKMWRVIALFYGLEKIEPYDQASAPYRKLVTDRMAQSLAAEGGSAEAVLKARKALGLRIKRDQLDAANGTGQADVVVRRGNGTIINQTVRLLLARTGWKVDQVTTAAGGSSVPQPAETGAAPTAEQPVGTPP